MYDETKKLIKFNRTNLVNAIYRVTQVEKQRLRREVKEYIWPRLDFMHGRGNKDARYFVFEEEYVETEWKDMISIHYINTSYQVKSTVMRIHIFMGNKIAKQTYVGFFTLRKIDEPRLMLSYIYPNWSNIYYKGKPLYVMTYQKTVHIAGKSLTFLTYPLFVQDNITVACAQASMISMTQYLHHKFDYKKVRIRELGNAFMTGKTKLYPSAGLLPTQMIEIFNFYEISIGYKVFSAKNNEEEEYEKYRQYIECSVESGVPVILGITLNEAGIQKRHILQIIGHTTQERKTYVVYDDSGYFLKKALGISGFVEVVNWEKLKPYIKERNSFIIYPIHEKVYLLLDDLKNIFTEMYNRVGDLKGLEDIRYSSLKETRYFLADNRDVKSFLEQYIIEQNNSTEIEKEIGELLDKNMTHFVWCAEVPVENGFFLFFADPTYGKLTTKNIFYNKIPIFTNKQFGILLNN